MSISLANAPISYGAFELSVGIDPNVPNAVEVLDLVSDAGYVGIDLGPVGYLGTSEELGRRLHDRGLALAGAYLEFPFPDPVELKKLMPELDAMLDTFDAVVPQTDGPAPRPTIADNGNDFRRANPGAGKRIPESGYDDAQWDRFADGLATVVDRCRSRGYDPVFHHETGTLVESPTEIERVLRLSDIALCLDTGHFLIGGGDPVAFLRKWSARIDHLHLKDASTAVFDTIVSEGLPATAIWTREVFPALGDGDVDFDTLADVILEIEFSGWLVVEQDILPQTAERFVQAQIDQRANFAYLRERGL